MKGNICARALKFYGSDVAGGDFKLKVAIHIQQQSELLPYLHLFTSNFKSKTKIKMHTSWWTLNWLKQPQCWKFLKDTQHYMLLYPTLPVMFLKIVFLPFYLAGTNFTAYRYFQQHRNSLAALIPKIVAMKHHQNQLNWGRCMKCNLQTRAESEDLER